MELEVKETDLSLRIRTMDQNVINANGLKADLEAMEAHVEQLEGRLFDRDQRAININFFYDLEDRLDIRLLNINQVPAEYPLYAAKGPRALKLHSTITYNISLNGSFQRIVEFLNELTRVEPLIRVTDINMTRGDDRAAGGGGLDARISLIVLAEKK